MQRPMQRPAAPAAQAPAAAATPTDLRQVDPVSLRRAVMRILATVRRPMTLDAIRRKLEEDGIGLPPEGPDAALRKVLYNPKYFKINATNQFSLSIGS